MIDIDGWNYFDPGRCGENVGDGRKLCTLDQDGMMWVGIRFWSGGRWLIDGEPQPSTERVLAWRELPSPAKGYWQRGLLIGVELINVPEAD